MVEQKNRKGPKGYQRSDDRLREQIIDMFLNQSEVPLEDVDVQVSAGVATLGGTVQSRQARYQLEEIADSAWGVKDVTNNLKVRSASRDGGVSAERQGEENSPTSGSPYAAGGQDSGKQPNQSGSSSGQGSSRGR